MKKSGALNLVKKEEVHLITLRHTRIPQGTPGDRGPLISSFLSSRLNPRWGHQSGIQVYGQHYVNTCH